MRTARTVARLIDVVIVLALAMSVAALVYMIVLELP